MRTRPCWVEIRTQTFEDNWRFLAEAAAKNAELLAIVKADAYGHSLQLCAPAAVRAGARWLGVTSIEEGLAARALCPDAQILVIGGVFPGQAVASLRGRLAVVAWEHWQLDELEEAAHSTASAPGSLAVHLEIDTGMSRQGAAPEALVTLLARFANGSPLRLEGIMTHLLAADEADGVITAGQFARLEPVLECVQSAGLHPEWLNVGNSASLLSGQAASLGDLATRFGMKALMRPGLALYGLVPRFDPSFDREPALLTEARQQLQPVLSWKTRIVGVRSVPAGTVVGYNATFVATEPMRLALLPAGYGDGLDRRLGNRFSLLVGGRPAPLVGRISMDQSVLDVTEIPDVKAGDEVVILGTQGDETISAFDHADAAGTIPWEVYTRVNVRVPRVEA